MTTRPLPNITDEAKSAFQCGWFSGIAVGFICGLGLAITFAAALKG